MTEPTGKLIKFDAEQLAEIVDITPEEAEDVVTVAYAIAEEVHGVLSDFLDPDLTTEATVKVTMAVLTRLSTLFLEEDYLVVTPVTEL